MRQTLRRPQILQHNSKMILQDLLLLVACEVFRQSTFVYDISVNVVNLMCSCIAKVKRALIKSSFNYFMVPNPETQERALSCIHVHKGAINSRATQSNGGLHCRRQLN